MNVSQLQQMVGTNIPLRNGRPLSDSSSDDSIKPQRPESLQTRNRDSNNTIDVEDPSVQKSTVSYLNKLLKFHGIGMQAEVRNSNGQTFIAFNDASTGNLIKRLKLEDVIDGLTFGKKSMVNLSV